MKRLKVSRNRNAPQGRAFQRWFLRLSKLQSLFWEAFIKWPDLPLYRKSFNNHSSDSPASPDVAGRVGSLLNAPFGTLRRKPPQGSGGYSSFSSKMYSGYLDRTARATSRSPSIFSL